MSEILGGYRSLGDKCVFLSFSPLPPLLHGLPLYQHWKVLFDQVCEQLNSPLFLPTLPQIRELKMVTWGGGVA